MRRKYCQFQLGFHWLSNGLPSSDGEAAVTLLFFIYLGYSVEMLKEEERHCDICEKAIRKGNHYFVVLVLRDHVPPNADIPRSGLVVDALGNVRVDLCHECKTGMRLNGDETVD